VPGEAEVTLEEALASSDLEALLTVGRRRTLAPADRLTVLGAALTRSDADGTIDTRAMDLLLELANEAPQEALASAQALKGALSEQGLKKLSRVWIAVADAASDEDAVAFLDDLALLDGPGGPLFRTLDDRYAATDQLDPRLALRAAVLKETLPDEVKRELLDNMISLLEGHGRHADALPHHADLALADVHTTSSRRRRARAAYKRWGGRPDRQWFLGRLARITDGDEAADILRELVPLRLEASDNLGAEAAARELLTHDATDPLALDALIDLLESDERRRDERIGLLQRRLELADESAHSVRARVTHALAAAHLDAGAQPAAIEVLRQHLLESPEDDLALSRVVMLLEESGREPDVEEVLEEVAERTQDLEQRRRLLLDAAERARARGRTERAGALCDRALDASPDAIDALLMRADLAVDHGDPEAALGPLERLASQTPDGPERARVHLRIGHLLEEHLLRPDDALKRYEAAAAGDPGAVEAWASLRSLSRQRKDRDRHVAALRGLAATHDDAADQAALLKEAAAVERDERADLNAAEALLEEVLALTPGDDEARHDLLTLLARRMQDADGLDVALEAPAAAFLREARRVLAPVMTHPAHAAAVPLDIARLWARALEEAIDDGAHDAPTDGEAIEAWEAVLERASSDRIALTRLTALLERRTRGQRDDDAQALDRRRKKLLETLLLHHAPDLDVPDRVSLWAELGALRWEAGESDSGRSALTKAFELADTPALRERLLARPATAAVAAWEGSLEDADRRRLIDALLRLFALSEGEAAVEALLRACDVADDRLKDIGLARQILRDGLDHVDDPTAVYERLLDLDLAEGDPEAILASTRALLEQELDPRREAEMHVRLGKLLTKVKGDKEGAGVAYRRAIELDPTNAQAIAGAEALFEENNDSEGLAELYSAQLKLLDRDDDIGRIALLERLAQVRRYDLRDHAGAIEALEAMCSLDPEAVKPREDAARLYAEVGDWRGAVAAWRSVLERDPLHAEAWRGLLSVYALSEQGDEAFAVAAAMVSAEVADLDLTRAVRRARPPFPRWPKPSGARDVVRLKVAHELERAPVRAVLDLCGQQVHPRIAQPLKEFGFSRRDRLPEKRLPQSVVLALRTVTDLLDLPGIPDLYLVEQEGDAAVPPFALLPAQEAGLIVQAEVLSGGMTPERAFALGRAMAWLTPHGLIAGTLSPAEVKGLLEALVLLLLPSADIDGDERELEPLARDLETHLFGRRGKTEPLRTRLTSAVRDYVHARGQLSVADWVAGVGYTGDRLGFLLAGDLAPSVRGIKSSADASQVLGARLAIKELLLFSISPAYLGLRRELGLALSESETTSILELV
jgi:tetratricopeptide (TPR) repeat protein